MTVDVLGVLTAFAAVLTPVLVYLASRARVRHDEARGHADDTSVTWERMTDLLDRYSKRTEQLEARVRAAERKAGTLEDQVRAVRGALRRWRAYAMALARQVEQAGLAAVSPVDFGIGPEDDGADPVQDSI